jgi:hypothetical protein
VFAAHLIVNASHNLSVVSTINVTVSSISTRIHRGGKLARDIQRRFTEKRWIDLVIVERGPQVHLSGSVAGGGSEGGKVAG